MTTSMGAIDQGTTSSRFILFDHHGRIVSMDQKEQDKTSICYFLARCMRSISTRVNAVIA